MTTASVSGRSTPEAIEAERRVAVLKKSQDVAKEVGQTLVDLVKASAPAAPGRIDTYA